MNKQELEPQEFVEYSHWLSQAHRKQQKKVLKRPNVLKGDQVVIKTLNEKSEKTLHNHNDPIVQLVEENGVVKNVEITCTCGEKVRLTFDYAAESNLSE